MRAQNRWLALGAIVAVGVALRVYRLGWGLPDYGYPDGINYFVRPAARLVALGEWVPPPAPHPPLLVYIDALVFAVWSLVTRTPIAGAGRVFYAQLPTLALVARGVSVAVAVGSILLTERLGRRLVGARAGLFAAAILALAPVHVLESHRVNPDGAMVLCMQAATLAAVVAWQGRRRGWLWTAFFLAGLAGGFKHNGPIIAAVPAWLALTWPDEPRWRRRAAWVVRGAGLMVAGIVV